MSAANTVDLTNELKSTRAELMWFFTSAAEAMGFHGSGFDGGGGQRVFDEEASSRVHRRMWSPMHRHEVAKRARVVDILWDLEPSQRLDLQRVYTPFGAGRVGQQTIKILTRQQRPLLGLMVHTEAIRKAFARTFSTVVDPPMDVMVRWIDDQLRDQPNNPLAELPGGRKLALALDEADRRETEAAMAYDPLRRQKLKEASQREHEELYEELGAISRRIKLGET